MADEKGALSQVADASQAEERVPGRLGALANNFYGSDKSLGQSMGDVVRELMPTKSDRERSSSMAFWGGFGAPNNSGQMSGQLANATNAQAARELEGEKLKASYVPMITQAMLANQTQTLAGNKQVSDLAKESIGPMHAGMASLLQGGNKPTREQIIAKAHAMGAALNLPRSMIQPYVTALPTEDKDLAAHLGQLGQALNPGGMGNQMATNAAGQTTVGNANTGNVNVAGNGAQAAPQAAPQAVAPNANPTNASAEFARSAVGDPKEYGAQLQSEAKTATDMINRFNEMHELSKEFTPGRLAERAGDISGVIKDIAARVPGINKDQAQTLIGTIMNSPENSPKALAAQQMMEQLMVSQVPAEIRGAIGAGNRMSVPEYKGFTAANLGTKLDPETLAKMEKFYGSFADRNVNRLSDWNAYQNDAANTSKSVSDFAAKDTRKYLDSLHASRAEKDAIVKAIPAIIAPVEKAIEAKAAENKAAPVDLKNYPPGAMLSASGKAYVVDANGQHRYAKPIK